MRWYFLCILLCALPIAQALTVSPASHKSEIGEGTQQYTLTVTNDETRELVITATPTGALASSITVDSQITLSPGESAKLPVTVRIPSNTQPGTLEGGVIFESKPLSAGTVAATSAVMHVIRLTTPQEGAYLTGELVTSAAAVNAPVAITLALTATGTEPVSGSATFSVSGQQLSTQSFSLAAGEMQNVVVYWTPRLASEYSIAAQVQYAGKTETYSTAIVVGNLSVNIQGLSFSEFRLGDPFRIGVRAQNNWGAPIPVSATVGIVQDNRTVRTGSSTAVRIAARQTETIDVYMESTGLLPGVAFMETNVLYAGKNTTTVYPIILGLDNITVQPPQTAVAESSSQWVAWVIVALMIGVVIAALRWRRK